MPFRLATLGAIAFVAGLVKLQLHAAANAADPFALAWCRTPGSEAALPAQRGGEWLLMGHCWGCYVAAAGAAMLAFATWRAWRLRRAETSPA